ncbi:DUF2017 family protein [Agromyces mediolanus]|uniref:DUF2017 domain-containing protein n=1 Tax=Agromyces mediolanus TaxID=41986 RepID=A0A918CDA5_AGRME|nr:DUF2017 family protein [Agromyces mediolanus]GGR18480.1 hypothetical protein GCM10010196_09480 [Agromyces mediolanus]GLJ71438.1 hypothetical protein GCM10017583_06940 [Agromyces mediolanus]
MIVAGRSGEGVRLVLEAEEAMLLSELADQVDSVLLLGSGEDPAIDRLLPNAYPDDVEAAGEFERYTRDSLVDGKRQAAQSVRDATDVSDGRDLVEIELDESQAWGWLTFLTDLRLILAERVGVTDDGGYAEDEERDDYLRAAYEWAGFVQGSMLEILDPMDA